MTDHCVCNQAIETEPYFGMELPDQDAVDGEATIVFFDPGHAACLREWGLTAYPDDELGIRHCLVEQVIGDALGETVNEALTRYLERP